MSTIDLGTATTAAELVDAARTANQEGKRLLLEKDGVNEAGETRYRLSAESQFSRYIRNVKAFITGGVSGYDHDRRVQVVFKHLIDKESDRHHDSTLKQTRLDDLSDRIRQVHGRSISGSAAALFIRLIDEGAGLSDIFPSSAESHSSDADDIDHDYEEIPELRFPGYETAEDWLSTEPSDVDVAHDYDYIDSQDEFSDGGYDELNATGQNDIDDEVLSSPIEPRGLNRASVYEVPVSRITTSVIQALNGVAQDPEAEKAPKLGPTQLRETRLSTATVDTIKATPALQAKTDTEFRTSLSFPERIGNESLLHNPKISEGFYLASLANTVKPHHFNKLSLVIDRHEFNEKLSAALAREDDAKDGIAGTALKGSKAADLLVASKVLDELLHEQEVSDLVARENYRIAAEADKLQYDKRLAQGQVNATIEESDPDDQFTPLNPFSREPDEVFTSPVPAETSDVDSVDEGIYAHLTDVKTK